jgi:2-methylcitrate dehydratase PrpD
MTTQVEALAKYAARGGFADLSQESRRQLPIHILDSLGCCIAALGRARCRRVASKSPSSNVRRARGKSSG